MLGSWERKAQASSGRTSVEKKFTSDEVPLQQLLAQARAGDLQLPDFQRGWVWDDDHITSLLASISLSYPIGAVMTLQTGNPDVRFRPRPLEGVQLAKQVEPEFLLLDGQQRATSLYLALMSKEPVPTRDAKGKDLLRRYYADIRKCLDPAADREEAIFSVPGDRVVRTFRGEVLLDLSSQAKEIEAEMFPLDTVLDSEGTMLWQHAYVLADPTDQAARMQTWMDFYKTVVQAFDNYQVPTIQLVRSTPKEAVCQVFEKVNTGGVSLTVFELLTATYAADDFNLRDDWEERARKLAAHDVLEKLDATQFLQIVTLLATYDRREQQLAASADPEKAPAISCKRRDVLRLELHDYQRWADPATKGLERVVPFLHSEHVFRGNDVPYATQLVPLAAIFAILGPLAEGHGARQQLTRWYWSGVFGEMYGGATETRFALDVPDVVGWIKGAGDEPRTIRDAQFQADRLLALRRRNSAAYKGLYALQMKRGARDFRTGQTIDIHAYFDDAIDIHHVFPQRWCDTNGIDQGLSNSIVNKTPIDAHTNRRIGGRAPSVYLASIESGENIAAGELDELLRSHDVDPVALRQDDFPGFFTRRFERLVKQIEAAMGKPVNRSADGSENPFADPEVERQAIEALIATGESKVVEFKSTGRLNIHTGDKDPNVEWSIIKSVAGFMNASGGTLLVGVTDSGEIRGIEADYPFLKKADPDGWGLWFTDAMTTALGRAAAAEVELSFCQVDGHVIARADVGPAATPVFAKRPKGDGKELYMVRINSSTQELNGPELLDHQKHRWRN